MTARAWLESRIGPRLDSILERIDRTVPEAQHRERAAEILQHPTRPPRTEAERNVFGRIADSCRASLAARPQLPGDSAAPVPEAVQSAFRSDAYEDGEAERLAHQVALIPGSFRGAAHGRELRGDAEHWPEQRAAAARLWGHLAVGLAPDESHLAALDGLIGTHAPGRWFRKRGAWYGSAAVLRASIAVSRTRGERVERTRELCDRLLRHVEVLRERALAFVPESLPADAKPPLERTRFALALFDATEAFGDLRYLNGALKLVDRGHWELLRGGAAEHDALLAHAVTVATQERMLRERFES